MYSMYSIQCHLHAHARLCVSLNHIYIYIYIYTYTYIYIFIYCVVTVWPSGTYAIPKSLSGCPLNWQEGWILQDLENTNSKTEFSSDLNLHMEATLTGNDVKRSFCVKTSTNNGETRLWPAGNFKSDLSQV